MNISEFSLLFISIIASVAGQFFLKAGALKLGKVNIENLINHIINITTTSELLIGLTCYAIGAITYILLLTRVNLNVAAPSISLVYVFSVLISYFLFKEPIPLTRILGLSLIICGVILVVYKK
ncbi:transporter protein [Rivularia sp. IAM M-261]|nr:transporter protein [Rivularia sp. IAM M-261]